MWLVFSLVVRALKMEQPVVNFGADGVIMSEDALFFT